MLSLFFFYRSTLLTNFYFPFFFLFNPLRTGVKPGFLTLFEKRANGEKG